MHIGAFQDAQVVKSIAVIGCQPWSGYASVYVYWPTHWHIFVCQLDASWIAEPVGVVIILSCAFGQWLLH